MCANHISVTQAGRGSKLKFGEISLDDAAGSFLAHAYSVEGGRLKKGTLLGLHEIALLKAAGFSSVIAARLETGDVDEDSAAAQLANLCAHASLKIGPASTGRVNIYASHAGLFVVNKAFVDAVNAVDPAITLATLAEFAPVTNGQMVATFKIIPFAVTSKSLDCVARLFGNEQNAIFQVSPWRTLRVGLVTTVLPSLKDDVIEKTNRVLRARLAASGSYILSEKRVAHTAGEVGDGIAELLSADVDLVIVFGASAVVDIADVIPQGIANAGGTVVRVGMPVDPGNLLVLGEVGNIPIIGAPGCARSPRENGFDWILDRVIAGIPVTAQDIAGLGVGGLLMEIETRPRPRDANRGTHKVQLSGLLLAAGQSSRTGVHHKLLAQFEDVPLLTRSAAILAQALGSAPYVVLGADATRMAGLLPPSVHTVINPDYAEGLSTSLRAGIACVPHDCNGVLIHLADMPGVTLKHIRKLADAFIKSGGIGIVRATHKGNRGNPVILPRSVFGQIARLEGDMGARAIVEGFSGTIIDVEIGEAASLDVDTLEAITAAGGIIP